LGQWQKAFVCYENRISYSLFKTINKDCMLDMLAKIENNKMLKGEAFYEKIIYAVDKTIYKRLDLASLKLMGIIF
jgi:hypothetical protein